MAKPNLTATSTLKLETKVPLGMVDLQDFKTNYHHPSTSNHMQLINRTSVISQQRILDKTSSNSTYIIMRLLLLIFMLKSTFELLSCIEEEDMVELIGIYYQLRACSKRLNNTMGNINIPIIRAQPCRAQTHLGLVTMVRTAKIAISTLMPLAVQC